MHAQGAALQVLGWHSAADVLHVWVFTACTGHALWQGAAGACTTFAGVYCISVKCIYVYLGMHVWPCATCLGEQGCQEW